MRIGDVAVIAAEPVEFPGNRFVSRSMDNRLGCYVALEAARLVAEAGGAPGDVYALAVAQEEITFGGARTTAYSLRPDVAIVVDVTFATDQPGVDEKELGRHRLRLPAASEQELAARLDDGPLTAARRSTRSLRRAAEAEGIPFTVSASARATGTDADAFHISRGGIPSGVVSVPLRYMHSPVEMVQLDDVENAAQADRRLRARLGSRHRLHALTAPPAVRHRRHAAAACLGRARRWRCARRRPRCTGWPARVDGVVEYAGRTDLAIARDLLAARGRAPDDRRALGGGATRRRWRPTSGSARRICRREVAPGIVELLEELAARPDEFRLSLVTGNLEPIARLKLERAGVGALLRGRPGRRSAPTTRTAGGCRRSRAPAPPIPPWPRERTVVIGDTPRDIACARVDEVRVVAVATGPFAVEALADADAVVDDARALLPVLKDWLTSPWTTAALPPPRRAGSATARTQSPPWSWPWLAAWPLAAVP